MKLIDKEIHLENPRKPLTIIPFGDLHIGNANFDKKYFDRMLNWIYHHENTYIIGMGDYLECIIPTDKRFSFKSVDKMFHESIGTLPQAQISYLKKRLYPIRHKIITLIPGNHEKKFKQHNYIDLLTELGDYLEVEIGHIMTFIKIRWDRNQFHRSPIIIFAHHGWFAGRQKGNKVNNMENMVKGFDANIYLFGHSHEIVATSTTRIQVVGKKIVECKKLFGNTGSLLKTVKINTESYSEDKGYLPTKVGVLRIDIYPQREGRPDIHIRE